MPLRTLLLLLIGLTPSVADAAVLCASHLGHVRLRDECRRHERRVNESALAGAGTDDVVPLQNWEVRAAAGPEGLESVASDSPSAMEVLDPCRLIDTRPGSSSAFVGDDIGAFADEEVRTYTLTGLCLIPAEATALSINLAIVPGAVSGFASVGPGASIPAWPPGPSFASINYQGAGPAISNSLIVPLDDSGQIDVAVARSADVIIDTNGYFVPDGAGTRTVFFSGAGTPTDNGDALIDFVDSLALVANAPIGSLWVLELGPGEFDLDTGSLTLQRRAALRGAGQGLTTITTAATSGNAVVGAGVVGVEVYDLRLDATGTDGRGISISSGGDLVARNVHVTTAPGGGVLLIGSNALLEHVLIEAEEQAVTTTAGSDVTVRDSQLVAMAHDTITALDTTVVVENSTLEALDTDTARVPIDLTGTTSDVDVRHCRLFSAIASYVDGAAGTFRMTQSFVEATPTSFGGTATCSGTAGPGTFVATGCP